LTGQTAHGSYTRGLKQDGGKRAIRQTTGTAGNFDGKSCSLVGEMGTKIRNLPQGNFLKRNPMK